MSKQKQEQDRLSWTPTRQPSKGLEKGDVNVTSIVVIEEYVDERGASPFGRWFAGLDARAAAKVAAALTRIEVGAVANVKGVGGGVLEFRIDFGPGFRVYFGRDGHHLVLLLGGGTKQRQDADIAAAKSRWSSYKARKSRA